MFMDGYNLYGYLLMCIYAYNIRWFVVCRDTYNLHGYLLMVVVCMAPF